MERPPGGNGIWFGKCGEVNKAGKGIAAEGTVLSKSKVITCIEHVLWGSWWVMGFMVGNDGNEARKIRWARANEEFICLNLEWMKRWVKKEGRTKFILKKIVDDHRVKSHEATVVWGRSNGLGARS